MGMAEKLTKKKMKFHILFRWNRHSRHQWRSVVCPDDPTNYLWLYRSEFGKKWSPEVTE